LKWYGKYGRKSKLNSEKIWKIQKKIEKRYGNYERKIGWIVKRFRRYRRNLWNDLENIEENSEKIGKIWRKISWIVKWYEKYGRK
jgi:hypothetical protein